MTHPTQAGIGLIRMGESSFVPANLEGDVRGKDVYDPEGQRIGRVEDLYIDRKEREVRFLEVGAGGFLGIGEKRFLVPVEEVVEVAEEWVAIEPGTTEKVHGPAPFDTKVAPAPAAEDRRAEDYASPRTATPAAPPTASTWDGTALMAAEDPSPTPTTSSNPHEAPYEATRQAMGSVPEEASTTTLAALSLSPKWVGLALLMIAILLAVYLGAGLLGESVAHATYP